MAILRRSISRLFSARFAIYNAISADIIRMLTCTGVARPLVARARAPVCPSLATPLVLSKEVSLLRVAMRTRAERYEGAFQSSPLLYNGEPERAANC